MLAEDAIKAAVKDYQSKQSELNGIKVTTSTKAAVA